MIFWKKKGAKEGEGERSVKLLRRGNPSSRPLLTRIWGTIGCLAITFFFIGFMIFLEKALPDGSKSQFHPTWRRDLSPKPRRQAALETVNATKVSTASAAPEVTVTALSVLTTNTINFDASTPASLCSSTQVDCTTVTVLGRLRVRGQQVECSTLTETFACSADLNGPIASPTTPPTTAPPSVGPSSSADACVTSIVECTDSDFCFTSYETLSPCGGPSSSSPPVITSPPVSSSAPPSTVPSSSVDPCVTVTSVVECTDSDFCFTSYETLSACGGASSSSPPIITSPPISTSAPPSVGPSFSVNPCVTSAVECSDSVCFTTYETLSPCAGASSSTLPIITSPPISPSPSPSSTADPCVVSSVGCFSDRCFTFLSTQASCLPTSTPPSSPPISSPTSSIDPCITSVVSCIETDCFTIASTQASCLPTSSPVSISPTSSNPCVTSTLSCIETDCVTLYSTQASCLSPSSLPPITTTSTTTVIPCVTSLVSCPVLFKRGKRQIGTDCVTTYSTAASCLPSSSPPILTPTSSLVNSSTAPTLSPSPTSSVPVLIVSSSSNSSISSIPTPTTSPSSLPSCITSTVSCPVIGKRQAQTDCETSFYSILGCGVNSTSSVASPTITPTSPSSVPITSSTSSNSSLTTPTPTPSINSCLSTEVICTPITAAPKIGAAIARIGGFFTETVETGGAPNPTVNCATTYASITGCGITIVSNSSSSSTTPPTTSVLSTSSLTPTISVSTNSSSSISSTSSFGSSTTPSSPILVVTPSTSSSTSASITPSVGSSATSSQPILVVTVSTNSSISTSSIPSTTPSSPILVVTPSTSSSISISTLISSSTSSGTRQTSSPTQILTPSTSSSSVSVVSLPSTSSSLPTTLTASNSVSSPTSSIPVLTPSTLSSSSSVSILTTPTASLSPVSTTPLSISMVPILSSSSSLTTPSPILIIIPTSSLTPKPLSSISTTSLLSPTIPPTSSVSTSSPVTPISVSSSSLAPPSLGLLVSSSSSLQAPSSLSTVSTAPPPPPPILVLTSNIPTPSNTPSTTPSLGTSTTPNTIPATLITSQSVSSLSASPPTSISPPLTTTPASISFGSTFTTPLSETESSATLPTAHLVTTLSPTNSASSTNSLVSLESEQASTSGTLPPGSRVTLSPSGTGGGGGGGGGNSNSSDNPTNSGLDIFPISKVVVGNYVPIIVGRAFVQFITPFYGTVLLHEPIRQLTNPGGAPFSSLAGSPAIAVPITAAMLIANVGSGFAAGATFLDTSYCTSPPCAPRLSSNPWAINVIITILVIQAIAILFMISQWWKKPNSLRADPTSIAGVAVVMGHPVVEQEFSSVPAELTVAELKRRLKGRRYKLGTFQTDSGITKFGIMPVPAEETARRRERKEGFFSKLGALKERIPFINDWRNNRFYYDTIFAMLLVALLALTCAALSHASKTEVVFLATAAASGTGFRIFLAILGTIVSTYWGRLFRDMQSFTPYIDLGHGDAEADPTILLRKHTFPITAFFPLLWKGHFTAASVAFTGLVAEFLIIALAGLPYRPGQQKGEFLFWSVLSLAILSLMVAQLLIVNVWRRRLPMLTRPPDTIAAVMTYVAGTGMSRDFESLSMVKTEERNEAIKQLGKSYTYGWRREPNGQDRWVIDEVRGKERVPFIPRGAEGFEPLRS